MRVLQPLLEAYNTFWTELRIAVLRSNVIVMPKRPSRRDGST
ncbi:MAG: hypothetical protein ACJ74Z_01485 [Bryobacteraceae bacterium]